MVLRVLYNQFLVGYQNDVTNIMEELSQWLQYFGLWSIHISDLVNDL